MGEPLAQAHPIMVAVAVAALAQSEELAQVVLAVLAVLVPHHQLLEVPSQERAAEVVVYLPVEPRELAVLEAAVVLDHQAFQEHQALLIQAAVAGQDLPVQAVSAHGVAAEQAAPA